MIESKIAPQPKINQNPVQDPETETMDSSEEAPCILDEIRIEELAIDGICGVY